MFVLFYTVNLYIRVFMTCSTSCCLYDTLTDPRNVCTYSGPSKVERFDSRKTWNSNKKFEKNSVWNSNKNSKVEPWVRHCTASCGSCLLAWKSNKLKVEPPLGTDCVRLSRVHCICMCVYVCMYSMYVCIVCMYVYVYACMYVYVYVRSVSGK
jgi:hypothetical protein